MTAQDKPPLPEKAGGASPLRSTIIASGCSDDGVCLMCHDCGHVFLDSIPLSDMSHGIDNVTLAKTLYYHGCALRLSDNARGGKRERRSG